MKHNIIHVFSMTCLALCVCFLTTTVTFLLIAAVHTVSVRITAPADGDAMTVFALELIAVALHITAILDQSKGINFWLGVVWCVKFQSRMSNQEGNATSSEPSAQSWSPSHFQRPAMQRPFVQANSLSEHCRGTEDREETS